MIKVQILFTSRLFVSQINIQKHTDLPHRISTIVDAMSYLNYYYSQKLVILNLINFYSSQLFPTL